MEDSDKRQLINPLEQLEGSAEAGEALFSMLVYKAIDTVPMQHPHEEGELRRVIHCKPLFSGHQHTSARFFIMTEYSRETKTAEFKTFKSLTCDTVLFYKYTFVVMNMKDKFYLKWPVMNWLLICNFYGKRN